MPTTTTTISVSRAMQCVIIVHADSLGALGVTFRLHITTFRLRLHPGNVSHYDNSSDN